VITMLASAATVIINAFIGSSIEMKQARA